MNLPVGSAADIAKSALLRAEEKLAARSLEAKVVLMIHDEIIWEVKAGLLLRPHHTELLLLP
jgi:DNA polymerase I-like protein with 3'-5' exonuclease and polymerase domains